MNDPHIHIASDGHCYLLVEEQTVGRETGNRQLGLELAKEKIRSIHIQMERIGDLRDRPRTA